jgi:hypothetical protein
MNITNNTLKVMMNMKIMAIGIQVMAIRQIGLLNHQKFMGDFQN